jgi:hypothetical protein
MRHRRNKMLIIYILIGLLLFGLFYFAVNEDE